jgi:hypothetical protein
MSSSGQYISAAPYNDYIYTTNITVIGPTGSQGVIGSTGPIVSVIGSNTGSVLLTDPNNTNNLYYNNILSVSNFNIDGAQGINVGVSGSVIPTANNVFTLGTTGQKWKDIYIGNGSVNIDNVSLSTTGPTGSTEINNFLYVNSSIVPSINSTYSLGFTGADANGDSLIWDNIYANNIYATQAVYANNVQLTSDYRIKENVTTLDSSFRVQYLNPVSYINKHTNKQDIGLIAHELQEIYPQLVTGEKNGENLQTINYVGLIPILINEIKNLEKRIQFLEDKDKITK